MKLNMKVIEIQYKLYNTVDQTVQEEKEFQQLVGLQCMKDHSEDCIISMWKKI